MKAGLIRKLLLMSVIAVLIVFYFIFDLGQYLSLDYLKASRERFQLLYDDHALLMLGAYFMIYVVVTALVLPAAAVLTLAGGALFGLTVGVVVVSFASTAGAALAFLVSRYVLRDFVQRKYGGRLEPINRGIREDGAFYLFTLRLIPVFPFFIINAVLGLTSMRLFTYVWVSQLGMLPATVVYVNAGKELGQLDSLSGLLSPSLIISFVVLGLFPLAVKKILGWYQAKRRANG
ncbi:MULTISPECIES: TVP38/TMEM64 family protein [unclassified Pseudodesulfovibrio]|uniref:TVP38/TMEM64 family protein n=1 Tax=unclassified Pseudodesulfovibrio TaxID=2661612 RepID=UPI000FEC1266|nr:MULTISPECIES: TVP38/TMEM64 family protein [unclassified Pseudodesulfovibrio]MCJ2163961.1 TVP38/TMEM64 family protein [Pseudodesulfovibrio sp. S3-i]RWU05794.1 TVP38/TMEM64 family protein [Pseudodesulfovibrio sp. S3]